MTNHPTPDLPDYFDSDIERKALSELFAAIHGNPEMADWVNDWARSDGMTNPLVRMLIDHTDDSEPFPCILDNLSAYFAG